MQDDNKQDEAEGIDPQKLFDEKQYSTLIINREGFSKKENSTADLIEALLEKGGTRAEHENIYSELKKVNAGKMLVDAISKTTNPESKKTLVAACWESGIDFSDHFIFFAELVLNEDFGTSMEALTVIEEMESRPSDRDAETILKRINEAPVANANVAELKTYLSNLSGS